MKLKNRSRPLFGVSIFLQVEFEELRERLHVLVPFSGFLSFYGTYDLTGCELYVLVPFSGFLSFYGLNFTVANIK